MPDSYHKNDYSRYFNLRQKVCLINVSTDRNSDVYESLSGVVVSSAMETLELLIASGIGPLGDDSVRMTYKLTSESLGSGIQILADLTGSSGENTFQFRMHGAMEMFQRRSVSRAEVMAPIFHLNSNHSLAAFRKEWKRITDYMRTNGALPKLVMQETGINLSAGGIGLKIDATSRPSPISMFLISLDEGLPVCALAETVWEKKIAEGLHCGFRFVHILKADQERINKYVAELIRKEGGTPIDYKRSWALVDKMVADTRKPV